MRGLLFASLLLAGCGGGSLKGTWVGRMTCSGLLFDLEMALKKDFRKVFVGTGLQERDFTNLEGQRTVVRIDFDVTLELDDASGAQDLATTITCTDEVTEVYNGGEGQVIAEGCAVGRFRDYVVGWDGEQGLTIAGPDGCSGALTLRGG